MKRNIIIGILLILALWLAYSYREGKFMDYFIIAVLVAIITGIFTSYIQSAIDEKDTVARMNKKLMPYTGVYKVYHWSNLNKPDENNYIIDVTLNKKNGILSIRQTGREPHDLMEANINIANGPVSYGEGIYVHPQKEKTPFGRIQLYFMDPNKINVDKTYLDIKGEGNFIPLAEKWQWRKS